MSAEEVERVLDETADRGMIGFREQDKKNNIEISPFLSEWRKPALTILRRNSARLWRLISQVESCQVNAMTLDDENAISVVDLTRCLGCGNCAVFCPAEAI